jgi:hypothetical protein
MNHFKMLALGLLVGGLFSTSALASSVLVLGDTPKSDISSIVYIGDPDPCADNACGTDEPAVDEASNDDNAALVDSYGMPTHMPVIMRPSVDNGTPEAPKDTAAAKPADTAKPDAAATPTAPATPAPTTPAPAAPAPVAPAPVAPAPVAPAPAAPTTPGAPDPSKPM